MVSAPSFRKMNRGRRLTRKAIFTAVFTWVTAQVLWRGVGLREVSRGKIKSAKIIKREVFMASVVVCIATTWICTKSFWFLRPMDELLSFRSIEGAVGFNHGDKRLAVFSAVGPLSVDERALTFVSRITI